MTIAFLPGDGVGPEVSTAARLVLSETARKFNFGFDAEDFAFGGAAIDSDGMPLPEATREGCANARAVFLGAIGGPKWDGGKVRPEAGLLQLRSDLGLYANLRPIKVMPGLEELSPLRTEKARGVDMLIVRELIGGIYFGDREEGDERARDECLYTREEVERVARVAFEAARARRGKVTSVDKANVLATSRLWRRTVTELHQSEYSDVELQHMLVDAMAMKLIESPANYDVVLTENLFGDILSDEASVISGSIGLAPSASLGTGRAGLYEPIHGSAPDIAGENKANPVGAILSGAMMLRLSLQEEEAAQMIESAVSQSLAAGAGTADIGGPDSCQSFAEKVCKALS